MTYKLKSGATIEGTPEEILKITKALGETVDPAILGGRGYYTSSTKGLLKISDMETTHLRNALMKQSKVFYEDLYAKSKTLTNTEFLNQYIRLSDNTTVIDLFTELSKRK